SAPGGAQVRRRRDRGHAGRRSPSRGQGPAVLIRDNNNASRRQSGSPTFQGRTFVMQFPSLQQIAKALGGEVSGNQVIAPGPGHSAGDRSLSIKIDPNHPDGFVVNSFAKDDPIKCKDYIREKAGLPAFKPNGKGNGRSHRADAAAISAALASAMTAAEREPPAKSSSIVATYDYTSDKGELLYQVVRLQSKSFRQRRPAGRGGWVWSVKDCKRVPYRLSDLLKYPDGCVFICEGEKDADRVAALDHCATTVACGDWT